MHSYTLIVLTILSCFPLAGQSMVNEYSFEVANIKRFEVVKGSCEVEEVDYGHCELIHKKSGRLLLKVPSPNCEQNKFLSRKLKGRSAKKIEFNKVPFLKVTATQKMNILVEGEDGLRTMIPFYSNQEAPLLATNSCEFPLTPEDHDLVAERAKRVLKVFAEAKTVYKNQFGQCYLKNSLLEIKFLHGSSGMPRSKLVATQSEFLGYKILDCATVDSPVFEVVQDQKCMIIINEHSVRVNCLNSGDSIVREIAEYPVGTYVEDISSEAILDLQDKGYERWSQRVYIKKAIPIVE